MVQEGSTSWPIVVGPVRLEKAPKMHGDSSSDGEFDGVTDEVSLMTDESSKVRLLFSSSG